MNWTSALFCAATVVVTIVVSKAVFPYAALSHEEIAAAKTPVDAELLDDVDLGDFGTVPVFDLVLHYIDNPPLESESEETKVRFQGC